MGFSVATTVLAAAASHDLTDLATAKDELALSSTNTSSDNWIGRAISQVSKGIETYTKRVFAPELVRDSFDIEQDPYPYQTPGGFAQLNLTRWPVIAVQSVAQVLAPGTTQALTQDVDFKVNAATGQLLRLNPYTGVGTAWEAMPVTVTYAGGFGAATSESAAVPASSPYTVTVSGSDTFSCDLAVSQADGTTLTRVSGAPASGEYSVAAGVYTFSAADAGAVLTIDYATLDVPVDLVECCLRLINGRYRAKDRDPALIQRETPGVGMERWWFGGAPGQEGPFPPDIAGMLESYRMPVVV